MYLSEREMLPHIRMARLYDTRKVGVFEQTKPRCLDCYELGFYLTEGGGLEINGEKISIKRGDIRFTRPGDWISSMPPYRCYTVFFHWGVSDERCQNELLDAIPGYFHAGKNCQNLFEKIVEMFELQGIGTGMLQNALLLQLLYQCYYELHSGRQYCQTVKLCVDYMQANMAQDVTLERLGGDQRIFSAACAAVVPAGYSVQPARVSQPDADGESKTASDKYGDSGQPYCSGMRILVRILFPDTF